MMALPESPAWLTEKGNAEAANRALQRINGTNQSTDLDGIQRVDEGELALGWGSRNHVRRRSRNSMRGDGIGRINSKSPLREDVLGQVDAIPSSVESRIEVGGKNENKYASLSSRCRNFEVKLRSIKLTLSRYRNQVYIALFLAVAQQFCGQTNILSYAPLIFAEAMKQDVEDGDNDDDRGEKDMSMIIIGLVKFFVTVVVIWRIEYIGRRYLLIIGNLLITAGLLALVIAFGGSSNANVEDNNDGNNQTSWSPMTNIKTFHLALPGVLLVVSGYSMSFGPLTWLLTSEIFPTEIRGRALGYTTIITYMCGAISTETFLYTQSILGPSFVFGIYCVFTIAGVFFVYMAIPETGSKTVEEIDESINQMSWWKYSAIALSQNDEGLDTGGPASPSFSEMVRNPSQLSVHSLT
jgi:hypothetical protein